MPITANVTNEQITASVGETQIDVSVSGGIGPTGPAGAAGASSWNDITGKPSTFTPSAHTHDFAGVTDVTTYTNFSPSGGTLGTALSGIDSALSGKAASSHAHGNITASGTVTTNTPDGSINDVDVVVRLPDGTLASATDAPTATVHVPVLQVTYGTTVGSPGITFSDSSTQTVAWTGSVDWSNVTSTPTDLAGYGITDAASLSHTHSAADVTSGTLDIARIPTGTSSTTVSLGDHTHAVTALTAGTWKTFYSNASGVVELSIGASGKVLTSNGTASAPTWETPTVYQKTITSGTAAPSGGSDGDIYLQY